MDFEGIIEFVKVAELLSFTKASYSLGCSPAHVSRKIIELENRLNIKLLYRLT